MEKKFDCLVCGTAVVDAIVKPVPLEEPIGKGKLLHVGPLAVTTGGLVCIEPPVIVIVGVAQIA